MAMAVDDLQLFPRPGPHAHGDMVKFVPVERQGITANGPNGKKTAVDRQLRTLFLLSNLD